MRLAKMLPPAPAIATISVFWGLVLSAAASCKVTVSVANPDDGTATVSSATVDAGASVTITATPTADGKAFNYWTGAGCFPQRLTHDASATFKVTNDCELVAHFATAYYVKTDGDDSKDGLTPATAKASVTAAVNAAQEAGDEAVVLVAAGTYTISQTAGPVNLTKAVTVRGTGESRDEVILKMTGPTKARIADLSHDNACLKHLTLQGNGFSSGDSSLYLSGPRVTAGLVSDCRVWNFNGCKGHSDNTAYSAVLLKGSGCLADSVICSNHIYEATGTAGGGVYMTENSLVENCEIFNNSCMGTTVGGGNRKGGGVFAAGGTIRNCLIVRNLHRQNGTGIAFGGNAIVESCTIADNYDDLPTETPSGVYRYAGSPKLSKCIIAGNWNWDARSNVAANANMKFENCCIQDQDIAGEGNVNASPIFANPKSNDYSIGAGPWDGMGYRPIDAKPFRVGFTVATDGAADLSEVTLNSVIAGDFADCNYTWKVQDESGTEVFTAAGADMATVVTSLSSGIYTVELAVENGKGGSDSFTGVGCIRIGASDVYVSTTGSGTDPYGSYETGLADIHKAIELVADHGTVHVDEGTYVLNRWLLITRPISIISRSGPDRTRIYSNPNSSFEDNSHNKSVLLIRHPEALFAGFHLRFANNKGNSVQGGTGIAYVRKGGTVSNCVMHALNAYRNSSAAARADVRGRFVQCVMRNGVATPAGNTDANRGLGIWLSGVDCEALCCVVSNNVYKNQIDKNLAIAGGGIYNSQGTVRSCLVVNNQHQNGGGGIYTSGGVIENCTVVGNHCLCTIAEGTVQGGGIYACGSAVIRNCIIRDNYRVSNPAQQDLWVKDGDPVIVSHCDFPAASSTIAPGTDGNIDKDPKFVDQAKADWRIDRKTSPCWKTGEFREWMTAAFDLGGRPRCGRGTEVDMGCYEVPYPPGLLLMIR